jgi:hypothetical protein
MRRLEGRDYRKLPRRSALQFEIGRDGDVDELSTVAPPDATQHDADVAQDWLRAHRYSLEKVKVARVRERLVIQSHDERGEGCTSLGTLDRSFDLALLSMGGTALGAGWRRPSYVQHAFCIGARTIVRSLTDQGSEERVVRRWHESGFWLAPMLVGVSTAYFNMRD